MHFVDIYWTPEFIFKDTVVYLSLKTRWQVMIFLMWNDLLPNCFSIVFHKTLKYSLAVDHYDLGTLFSQLRRKQFCSVTRCHVHHLDLMCGNFVVFLIDLITMTNLAAKNLVFFLRDGKYLLLLIYSHSLSYKSDQSLNIVLI